MEFFFNEFIPVALLVIGFLSLFMLLAIAATLAKLLKYLSDEGEGMPLIREKGELLQGPDYVDQSVLRGRGEPHSDGVNQRPPSRNWDGVPRNE